MAGAPSPPRPGRAELDTGRETPKWSPESALRNAAPARGAPLWTAQGAGPRPDPPLRPRDREAAPRGHRTWLTALARPSRELVRLPGAGLDRAGGGAAG